MNITGPRVREAPALLAIGIESFRAMPRLEGAEYCARIVAEQFAQAGWETECLVGEEISRPNDIYTRALRLAANHRFLLVYIYTRAFQYERSGEIFLAHSASTPGRSSSHVSLIQMAKRLSRELDKPVAVIAELLFLGYRNLQRLRELSGELERREVEFLIQSISNKYEERVWRDTGLTHLAARTVEYGTIDGILTTPFTLERLSGLMATSAWVHGFASEEGTATYVAASGKSFQVKAGGASWLSADIHRRLSDDAPGVRGDAVQEVYALRDRDSRAELTLLQVATEDPDLNTKALARSILMMPKKHPNRSVHIAAHVSEQLRLFATRLLEDFISVPEGNFVMGSSNLPNSLPEETPEHTVSLPAYRMLRAPVTNSHWGEYMAYGRGSSPLIWDGRLTGEYRMHPVSGISWFDALGFCGWLDALLHRLDLLSENEVVQLPSEAEWEKAARGDDARAYPWGQEFDPLRCNCVAAGIGDTTQTGTYSPRGDSPFGLQDMAGNVWEWTRSLWGPSGHQPQHRYPYVPYDGRENIQAPESVRRVIRGGTFYYTPQCVQCTTRNMKYPGIRQHGGGCRPVIGMRPS